MPSKQQEIMHKLYGYDVWSGFVPSAAVDVQGWNGDHPSLSRLASSGGTVVIDVGVWMGQSTITLANAMKRADIDGCVIAVDTFLGSPEHWSPGHEMFARQNSRPDIFERFLSNVVNAGVADYIVPLPQTSVCAASIIRRLGISASVAHIDAAHEYEEVLRDAEEYWPILTKGGYLIGDDYHATWPGVVRAAGEFSARNLTPLVIEIPKWIVQKQV